MAVKSLTIKRIEAVKNTYIHVNLPNFITTPQPYLMEEVSPHSVLKSVYISEGSSKGIHLSFTEVEYFRFFVPKDKEEQIITVEVLGNFGKCLECVTLMVVLDIIPLPQFQSCLHNYM